MAFIDYGTGTHLVSSLLNQGLTVDHLISMSDDGELLVLGTSSAPRVLQVDAITECR